MSASISGLVSGMDTASLVDQLMALEAIPQNRLKTKINTETTVRNALQSLNTKVANLATKAADLTKPETWEALTAKVTGAGVTATAGAGAATGTYTFTVGQHATTQLNTYTTTAALDDQVVPAGTTLTLDTGDGPLALDTGSGTLQDVLDALNMPDTGLVATTIRLDDGTHRLRVESRGTGNDAAFTLALDNSSEFLGGADVRAAQNATLTIGGDTVSSSTNTFADVLSGVTITLGPDAEPGDTVTIEVNNDPAKVANHVRDLVNQLNAVLADIDLHSRNTVGSKGVLAGDAGLRNLRSALLETIYPTDGTTLASLGVELDREGKFVFNESTFTAEYNTNPAAAIGKFATLPGAADDGFASRIQAVAKAASDSTSGTLTLAAQGRSETIKRLEESVASWDLRLERRRSTLARQFVALETALSQMNSQSNWLAGQLAGMQANNPSN